MSFYHFPSLAVADDVGLFTLLESGPMAAEAVATKLSLSPRATEALLGVMTGLEFLALKDGAFEITDVSRRFLLPSSPYYWGPMFRFVRDLPVTRATLKEALVKDRPKVYDGKDMWETHEMNPEQAVTFTKAMHARSLHLGVAAAERADFSGVTRILDVAGGSGCFMIPLVQRNPDLKCTVMELKAVSSVARETIAEFKLTDRIDVVVADMFGDPWPAGHDAVFFSNIYHDWDRTRCLHLTKRSFEALPSGGRIYVHEVLLDDDKTGPLVGITDSMHMMFFTEGKQRTRAEFDDLFREAGFVDTQVIPTFAYYSVVSGRKP